MLFFVIVLLAATSATYALPDAKPSGIIAAAPLAVAPAVITAQSSQVIARQYNLPVARLISPQVAAPALAGYAVAAPYLASPYVASPYVASPYLTPVL
ncbi:unnamed protein product [Phyllotreta striolata]|uniref:Uncharacterized protein n=1 Tax=Phyllotreta striolata TaxID=444603 RepID=A0A9N9TTF3_PHYSR|nr:unnamed protein product [Phyllotreta striolata]